ncbi:MAG: hypothetical protein RLZZ350_1578 [Verrucomicrobiota bacterium]
MPKPTQIFSQSETRWLNENAEVWRYVPLRTLFSYLNGLVFIPSVAKLRAGDPFEGQFYEDIAWFNTAFSSHYEKDTKAMEEWMLKVLCSEYDRHFIEINRDYPNAREEKLRKHYFDFIRRTRFAWCWFQSYQESAAMWNTYGNQGVAIKSTVGKICEVFEKTTRDFIYGRMTYVDYRSGVSTEFNPERSSDYRLLLRPFFLKRMEYKSEQEVRFVTSGPERDERGGILLENIQPQDWISEIRLWPGLKDDEAESIIKAVTYFIPGVNCQKSDLFTGPDSPGIMVKTLADISEKLVDSNWVEEKDAVPPQLKEP